MTTALTVLEHLPEGFMTTSASELADLLGGPTLIHLHGLEPAPLFVSVLLHGNETTGFEALQCLLQEYVDKPLPRALSFLVGNVEAAKEGLRVLPGQSDFNRIWPDRDGQASPLASIKEAALTAEVVAQMQAKNVFASIDLHNTSGRNPHHACITSVAPGDVQLASLFSRQILFFEMPRGVQNMAFSAICPSMTAECGQAGRSDGVGLTFEFLHRCIHLKQIPEALPEGDLELYRSMATVKVPDNVSFGFGHSEAALSFVPEIDGYNWREIPAGTELARVREVPGAELEVWGLDGSDLREEFLLLKGEKLVTRRSLVPAMLSLDESIVRQDCLCYFLERVS